MKKSIKFIRILVFSILLLMFMGIVIVECIDTVKIRDILYVIFCCVDVILIVILLKEPKCETQRLMLLDFLSIAIFLGMMAFLGKGLSEMNKIQKAFNGNNGYVCFYAKGLGDNGYNDIESALESQIENRKKAANYNGMEEIYRVQAEEKIFVYFKEDNDIVEYEFFIQDDVYYISGSKSLLYNGIGSSDKYTVEETIRKDIANTMWRGSRYDEIGAPAWGVSDDEQIFSITINAENVDDVILINEIDGKKYYFWIMTNVGKIKTIDDVKEAKIEFFLDK